MTLPPDLPRSFDHAAALAHYDQAIARLEQRFGASHPSLPGLLHSAAEELCGLGDYLSAITRAERAVALYTAVGDQQALAAARDTLARAYGGVNF
jgi:tetratricopeptide (TPR) repeat protein